MTKKSFLNMITFGFFEYLVTLLFSFIVCIPMLMQKIYYPVIICASIIIIDLIIAIWHLWNKIKAKAYLITALTRTSLLIVIFTLLQSMSEDMEQPDMYVVTSTLVMSILMIIINYVRDAKYWNSTFEKWQQVKKVDLEHRKFCIIADSDNGMNMDKKSYLMQLPEIVIFIVLGCSLSWVIGKFFGQGYTINATLFCFMLILYIILKFISYLVLCTVKIIKLEKEMSIELLTEYADKRKLIRLSKIKISGK
jgi:hypothetical protein